MESMTKPKYFRKSDHRTLEWILIYQVVKPIDIVQNKLKLMKVFNIGSFFVILKDYIENVQYGVNNATFD